MTFFLTPSHRSSWKYTLRSNGQAVLYIQKTFSQKVISPFLLFKLFLFVPTQRNTIRVAVKVSAERREHTHNIIYVCSECWMGGFEVRHIWNANLFYLRRGEGVRACLLFMPGGCMSCNVATLGRPVSVLQRKIGSRQNNSASLRALREGLTNHPNAELGDGERRCTQKAYNWQPVAAPGDKRGKFYVTVNWKKGERLFEKPSPANILSLKCFYF